MLHGLTEPGIFQHFENICSAIVARTGNNGAVYDGRALE